MLGAFPKSYGLGSTVNAVKSVGQIIVPASYVRQQDMVDLGLTATGPCLQEQSGKKLFELVSQNQSRTPAARKSINNASQYRFYHHNDIKFPKTEFDQFRMRSAQKTEKTQRTGQDENVIKRKMFQYTMYAGIALPGALLAKNFINNFARSFYVMAKDIQAAGTTEVVLDDIPEGKTVLMTWRSKPLFVRHRTPDEIKTEKNVGMEELRHQQTDAERCVNPEWLIVVGVCTHLGCVPVADAGAYGGFFCPCHGSHYDTAGRIRKGPAPLNLEVPPVSFTDSGTAIVG